MSKSSYEYILDGMKGGHYAERLKRRYQHYLSDIRKRVEKDMAALGMPLDTLDVEVDLQVSITKKEAT